MLIPVALAASTDGTAIVSTAAAEIRARRTRSVRERPRVDMAGWALLRLIQACLAPSPPTDRRQRPRTSPAAGIVIRRAAAPPRVGCRVVTVMGAPGTG